MNNDEGSPFLWRHASMIRAVVMTVAILSITTFGAIFFYQTWMIKAQASHVPEVPEYLLPGQPVPAQCDYTWRAYYPSNTFYCRNVVDGTFMYAEYSQSRKIITRVSYSVDGETVGDLILAWGIPTGMQRYNWGVEIYWGKRSVWASTEPFTPMSRIFLVAYTLRTPDASAWHGFINGE